MWRIEPTPQYVKDQKWYEKKRPNELAAALYNLKRYVQQLNAAPNSKAFTVGYIHPEPHGVVAIDQRGGGGNLQETRLYVYPDEARKVLYIITIGNKDEQPSDVQFCNDFVGSLVKKEQEQV
ncbi:MAG: hypothetical protein ABSD57_07930 [Verrucomicrobiota bacterium]|jgi:hypothetical protein